MVQSLAHVLIALTVAITTLSTAAQRPHDPARPGAAALAPAPGVTGTPAEASPPEAVFEVELSDRAFGRSGALRIRLALPGEQITLPLEWLGPRPEFVSYGWIPMLGTPASAYPGPRTLEPGDRGFAPTDPGVYELELTGPHGISRVLDDVSYVVQVPFDRKKNGYLAGYHIGRYPTEGSGRTDRYAPPVGFVRVTRAVQELRISDHFTVKEFLTHDQGSVWPKFLVLDLRLFDKLELLMAELNAQGIRADHMVVMSGFRTPQYNGEGLGAGRARLSRHQYGDAADVWVDNNGDWYMDDLNGDGRRDTADARVMLRAMSRVEARHPELIGGGGVYRDNGVHGPFLHVDARGYRARW